MKTSVVNYLRSRTERFVRAAHVNSHGSLGPFRRRGRFYIVRCVLILEFKRVSWEVAARAALRCRLLSKLF